MEYLTDLVNSDDTDLAKIGALLLDLQKEYKAGTISKEEYVEILTDIELTHDVNHEGANIELTGKLLKGLSGLLKLV